MADEAIKRRKTEESSQQSEDAEPQRDWFTQRRLPDDVILKFDDGKELFASRGLLMCASPVFEAMFTHDMKEKVTNVVDMSGRNYDHFLELLKCLHPGIAKPVTHENVFYLADVVHEYDIKRLSERCHDVFTIVLLHKEKLSEKYFQLSTHISPGIQAWLEENNNNVCSGYYTITNNAERVNNTLKILSFAAKIQDELLLSEAINLLSHVTVIHYDNIEECSRSLSVKYQEILKENKAMFDKLDVGLRARIFRTRLHIIDSKKK